MLNNRDYKLLKEVIIDPSIKSVDIQTKFTLTRRQVDYRFKKINEWLKKSNYPEIERTRQGEFIINPLLQKLITDRRDNQEVVNIPNREERANLILLMLLSSNEEYSLNHFVIELEVSKNTVLTDLKEAQKIAELYKVKIKYSRKLGYELTGSEFDIRRLLIQTVIFILNMINGDAFFRKVTGITEDEIQLLYTQIEEVEKDIDLRYTDEKILTLPYIMKILFKRIDAGAIIGPFSITYYELSDTKEYKAAEKLLLNNKDIPVEEHLFITLKLLSTNVSSSRVVLEEIMPDLKLAVEDMLVLFEKLTLINIQHKDQLMTKILLHLKPAYYRIKYNLTSIPVLGLQMDSGFQDLFLLVKKSSKPLADFLKVEITNDELTYLTMLIGGWLKRQGDNLDLKPKAIVVCPKGVSVSRLLTNTLTKLFPEFIFIEPLSVRDFYQYDKEYQIVFSTEILETDKQFHLVDSFITTQSQLELRRKVLGSMANQSAVNINWEEVIKIIERNAKVLDRESIIRELKRYFNKTKNSDNYDSQENLMDNPNLTELIKGDYITCVSSVQTYEEGIRIAAEPLLKNNDITQSYIEEMVTLHVTQDPYAVLGNTIAIPHAGVEDGVNKMAMSMLKIEEGVEIAEEVIVQFIVVIATDEEGNHLRALQQLDCLSVDSDTLTKLIKAKTEEEVYQLLIKFLQTI